MREAVARPAMETEQPIDAKLASLQADVPGVLTRHSRTPDRLKRARMRTLLIGAAVTLAYVAAAELGFRAAFVAEQVTTVWAPTGIAIASLLIWGPRLWPAFAVSRSSTSASGASPTSSPSSGSPSSRHPR